MLVCAYRACTHLSRGQLREGTSFPVAPPASELPGVHVAFLADLAFVQQAAAQIL